MPEPSILQVVLMGLITVFIGLVCLIIIVRIMGAIMAAVTGKKTPAAAPVPAPAAPAAAPAPAAPRASATRMKWRPSLVRPGSATKTSPGSTRRLSTRRWDPSCTRRRNHATTSSFVITVGALPSAVCREGARSPSLFHPMGASRGAHPFNRFNSVRRAFAP